MKYDLRLALPGRFCATISSTTLISLGLLVASCSGGAAQTYSSGTMWGVATTGGYGSNSTTDSSAANHLAESQISNFVEAAKAGIILNPNLSSNLTIQSVGSQTIVSNTVTGNNNTANISGSQTSSNSGSVSNTATSNY